MGDGLLGNLVFVVVAILAWIVKEAVERKEAKGAGQKRGGRTGGRKGGRAGRRGPAPDAGTGEVDVVYGRRKIPAALTAPPPTPTAKPTAAQQPRPSATRAGARPSLGAMPTRALDTQLSVSSAVVARAQGARRTPREAWARLGVVGTGAPRAAVRAGILWSEVLGPPRAQRGPHRSPVVERMQKRS